MTTIERIIEQEIFTNASTLISSLCRSEDPELMNVDRDDLTSVCIQPDYSTAPGGYEVEETDGGYYWYQLAETDDDAISSDSVFATPEAACSDAWDDYGDTPEGFTEALQHWIVSDWLAEKIIDVGGMAAIDICGFAIWGRSECGIGLDMDSTLKAVVELLSRDA